MIELPAPIDAPTSSALEESSIREMLDERILVLDGGMGTALHPLSLTAADFGGPDFEGCNEALNLTRPDVITKIHQDYLEAGADIVETNSFGGTPLVLDEFALGARTYDINLAAARLARKAAEEVSTPDRPRLVAGAFGPTTKTIAVTGGITLDEMTEQYYEQARGLIDGEVDLILIETCLDTLNAKAAARGVERYFRQIGRRLPVMLSCTIELMGTMLAGQTVEAYYTSMEHTSPLSVGMNCSTGPEFMTEHLRALSDMAWTYVTCYPNAGLPDEDGNFSETPDLFASRIERFVENGWLNVVGGCCGTHKGHIAAVADLVRDRAPRRPRSGRRLSVSGIEFFQPDADNRPIIVGERTNSLGSRKFKQLIAKEKYEEASEIGRKQVRGGAQVLDICLQNPDRNELEDMERFLRYTVRKVKIPLMIDSTDAAVVELFLKRCQGKAIVNSINLEDGEERFKTICPLLAEYGAAVVVGCIDEDPDQGMAVTPERKLEVARRSYDLLTGSYGIEPRNIIFDPLVFPAGTGDENYVGSAIHTIEGVRRIKEALPDTHTILGISNVSFGLPAGGREVLNSVFLYHCTKAGLDFAIVNSEKLERYASIPQEEKKAAEDLLFARTDDAISAFAALFRDRKVKTGADEFAGLSLDERISKRIIEGTREGMIQDLDEALKTRRPLKIINGPLMAGMDEVGRLFGNNELIVSEVLQSAEAMKASVTHLEQFMVKEDVPSKGRLLLATVKGDVHDIGKNLVEIILSNNGFDIVNLGIKIPSDVIVKAYREHQPDAIGLSGLLVKSAQQMVSTASDLRAEGIDCPILVGGAALTRKFTHIRIAPEYGGAPVIYAKDAMDGLAIMNQLADEQERLDLLAKVDHDQQEMIAAAGSRAPRPEVGPVSTERSASVPEPEELPPPPDLLRHVNRDLKLSDLLGFVNPQMLYAKHLGLKGRFAQLLEQQHSKALELKGIVDDLAAQAERHGWIQPAAVWKFFPARSDGNDLILYEDSGKTEIQRFQFLRQSGAERLCLADYTASVRSERLDHIAMFVTTAGGAVRQVADRLKAEGEYLACHALQALAIETAEAYAEALHQQLRLLWGFPDPDAMSMIERFQCKYRGIRVSFGYPACPNLEDQEKLFSLLQPQEIGVTLTDGHMMEPEASVSALAFHHRRARYFNAGA